jgi:hypothetical protein
MSHEVWRAPAGHACDLCCLHAAGGEAELCSWWGAMPHSHNLVSKFSPRNGCMPHAGLMADAGGRLWVMPLLLAVPKHTF